MSDRMRLPWVLPPSLAAAVLVALLVLGGTGPFIVAPEASGYMKRVAEEIDRVPHQFGPWLGVDIPTTPAAVELLKPNRVIQRRYTNAQTGETFELLIVHCGDVRDMDGHYPPICYPAHGWTLGGRVNAELGLTVTDAPARSYRFSRTNDIETVEMIVTNLFAVPAEEGPAFGADLTLIQSAGRVRTRARLGAAQVQVITPGGLDEARRDEIVRTAFSLVESVFRTVAEGPADE
jgi:hypothetical protein